MVVHSAIIRDAEMTRHGYTIHSYVVGRLDRDVMAFVIRLSHRRRSGVIMVKGALHARGILLDVRGN
jgi:hypothetical protein